MKSRTKYLAVVAGAAAVIACVPATALGAVTAAVTGDDGNPALLTPGAPLGIRNMDVKAYVHVDSATNARSFLWQVTDASGTGVTTASSCSNSRLSPNDEKYVTYRGNQAYTLTLSLFSEEKCTTLAATQVYVWTVGASVGLGQPAGPLLIRQPNSYSTITQQLDFSGTPGATSYEFKYAKGGVIQPDGSISSPAINDGYLNRSTGKVDIIGAREPGEYVVVARAKNGGYFSPWSAPVTMRLIAPFDIASRRFPDAIGPRYSIRGEVREHSAGGKVTVSVANGKKGKKFRTLGKAKVSSKGIFNVKFTLRKRGTYRLRYSFPGSATVARGTIYEVVKITRVLG